MKIKASATMPEEGSQYRALLALIRRNYPRAKFRESTAHPPQKVLYVTTEKPGKATNGKE